jgi:hypothetical protein
VLLAVFWLVVSINCVRDVARSVPAQGAKALKGSPQSVVRGGWWVVWAPSFRVEVAAAACGQSRWDGPVLQAFKHCNRRNGARLQRE